MAGLTGKTVATTYHSLLKVSSTDNQNFDTTLRDIVDGEDTASCLKLATDKATVTLGTDAGDDFLVTGSSASNALVVEGESGQVGIGTASPSSPLSVESNIADEGVLAHFFDGTMADTDFFTINIGKAATTHNCGVLKYSYTADGHTGNYISLGLKTTEDTLTVTSNGRVGIGTAAPSELLHIDETTNDTNVRIRLNARTSGGVSRSAYIGFDGGSATSNDNYTYIGAAQDNTDLVIRNNGNVGIGTSAPDANLHVSGAGSQAMIIGSTNAGGANLVLDGDSNGDGAGGDYSYLHHDTAGIFNIVQDSPSGTNEIRFGTAGTEDKVVINADGEVGIGHTNPAHDLCVGDNVSGHHTALRLSTNTDAVTSVIFATAGTSDKWNISNSAADQLYIYDYGDSSIAMHCDTTEEAWGTGSDSRIKENVANIGSILTKLNDLNPITYQRKYSKSDKFYAGLVAQEVLPNFPLVVTGSEDTFKEIPAKDAVLDDDGNVIEEAASLTYEGGLSLKYSSFVPYLIKAIQELSAKVTALENA